MVQKLLLFTAVCLGSLLRAQSQPALPGSLPVKRVVLFKNGVGYFEHVGSVRGNESVRIAFTSGQLNDVLKSLTVLDLNGGRIASVGYESATPVSRQISELNLPINNSSTLTDVLDGLRGTRVEVKNNWFTAAGRILNVERKNRILNGVTQEIDYLSLLSENGELRTVELSPSASVRFLEPGLAGRLDQYLTLLSPAQAVNTRNMVIADEGTGDRNLYVSYISEVPVWKATYRLVLTPRTGKASLLQGWAVVDNVVGEDWNNVELSLVAGAPQSFIQNLSQPFYAQRPTVDLPAAVSTSPQTSEATLVPGAAQLSGIVTDPSGSPVAGAAVRVFGANENLLAQTTADAKGAYEFSSLPEGPIHLQIQAAGFQSNDQRGIIISAGKPLQQNAQLQIGSSAQSVEVVGGAISSNAGRGRNLGRGSSLGKMGSGAGNGYGTGIGGGSGGGTYRVDDARAQFEAAARSQALGDLFEYKLKEPVTILKNRSALVPILQAPVDVEKVSVWNERTGVPRPQRAVWITNNTGLTLDGGSMSVLEDNTFTGEGIFDPIRPGEKRLLNFAIDLAVNASAKAGSQSHRVSRIVVSKGVMTEETEQRETKVYTFRNEDTTSRVIVVEHPVRSGYELKSEIRPVETTADWMRFRIEAPPKQTVSLTIEEAQSLASSFQLSNLTPDLVALFSREQGTGAALQKSLQDILSKKNSIDALESQKSAREEETQKIFDDQQRLRENIKALRGTPEEKPLLKRYTTQLNEQETRLATLQAEVSRLDATIDEANEKLDDAIQKLSFDVKL